MDFVLSEFYCFGCAVAVSWLCQETKYNEVGFQINT